jgi:ribosomal protein S18 acetylase RimI-like enzyme
MTISIRPAGLEAIGLFDALWQELHATQGATAERIDDIPQRTGDDTGRIVHDLYAEMLRSADGFAFLATRDDGNPVGYLVGTVIPPSEIWDTGLMGYVDSLYVRADQRNQGIGVRLLEAAYAELATRGIGTISLDVVSANADAVRLYRRQGFTPTLLRMVRPLAPPPAGAAPA